MKTPILFLVAALLTALTLGTNVARAQVKIGTNHQTIGANSNLEVESTTNSAYKTIVDKDGKVIIQDGTQGAGKVLTSDATGKASWKSLGGQAGSGFNTSLSATSGFTLAATNPPTYIYPFPNVTISEAGTYMAIVRTFGNVSTAGAPVAFYTLIRKNNTGDVSNAEDVFEWYAASGLNGVFGVSGTLIFTANAGDLITIGFTSGYGNQTITVPSAFLKSNSVRFVKIR